MPRDSEVKFDLRGCLCSLQDGQARVERQLDDIMNILSATSARSTCLKQHAAPASPRITSNNLMGCAVTKVRAHKQNSDSVEVAATESETAPAVAASESEVTPTIAAVESEAATASINVFSLRRPSADDAKHNVSFDLNAEDVANFESSIKMIGRRTRMASAHVLEPKIHPDLETPMFNIKSYANAMRGTELHSAASYLEDKVDRKHGACMLHPNSHPSALLNIVGVIVLFVELTVTPYSLAWELPADTLQYITYCTLSFWSLDLLVSFRTGFYTQGVLEMNPAKVAWHYTRTYLFPDLLLISIDVVGIAMHFVTSDAPQSSRAIMITRVIKVIRALRILKVLRVSHLYDRTSKLKDTLLAHHSSKLVVEILEMFLVVVWINHVVACGWFALSQYVGSDTGAYWLDTVLENDATTSYGEIGIPFQYATSLHWALTQMTPGSMPVAPTNTVERVYNILVLLFGMFVFSSIVSSISSKKMQYKFNTQATRSTMAQLRKFMIQHNVQTELAVKVQKQVKVNLSTEKKLIMNDLEALDLLNASVRAELHGELCRPHLCQHRLLLICVWSDSSFPRILCRDQVVDDSWLTRGKALFDIGMEAQAAYYVISGNVLYTPDGLEEDFDCKSWFSDISLFMPWTHVGSLCAETTCETLTIHVAKYLEALQNFPVLFEFVAGFARALIRIFESSPLRFQEVDDAALPDAIIEDSFMTLSGDCQVFVGLTCATKLQASEMPWAHFSRKVRDEELKDQIVSRSCLIYPDANFVPHRLVTVVAVKLIKDNGSIFVEIGKMEAGQIKATCTLPGKKARLGEAMDDCLHRILTGSLADIHTSIDIETSEDSMVLSSSASLAVKTKYLKRTYVANVSKPFSGLPGVQVETHLGVLDVFALARDGGDKISYYTWLDPSEVARLFDESSSNISAEWNPVLSRVNDRIREEGSSILL